MMRQKFLPIVLAILLTAQPLHADSPAGIDRKLLESHIDAAGNEFRLVLVTYPPGVGLPKHHHSAAGFNYILEGAAESQYAGEAFHVFKAGESFQDEAEREHTIFRNANKDKPLKYLLTYTVKAGESFLLVP